MVDAVSPQKWRRRACRAMVDVRDKPWLNTQGTAGVDERGWVGRPAEV